MSKDKVVPFVIYEAKPPIDPNRVLTGAVDKLSSVLLVGYDLEGELYIASSRAEKREVLYLLELVKLKLMLGDFDDSDS